MRTNLSKDKKTQKADNARIMKQNVKLLEEINELSRQLHRLDLETSAELKKKKELKKMKETGNTALDDDLESVHKPI